MMALDEDSLACDMAESYGIFDIYSLPVKTVATLAAGLRPFSRIKSKLYGLDIPLDVFIQASILDNLRLLWWAKTTDAQNGKNRPESLTDALTGRTDEQETQAFDSGKEFKDQWEKLTKGGGQNG